MLRNTNYVLYLSKDGRYLTNNKGYIISVRTYLKGEAYYRPLALESVAFERLCLQLAPQHICILWDGSCNCLVSWRLRMQAL